MISFHPNCTFPLLTPSGFVNAPNIRTTMDIVWSCISIIILSTWSVLHLNVPPNLTPKTVPQWIRNQFYLFSRKLAWMGVMLASPEFLVAISARKLFVAWLNTSRLKELANEDRVPWSLTHTILANMGGIAVRFSQHTRTPNQSNQRNSIEMNESTAQSTLDTVGLERPRSVLDSQMSRTTQAPQNVPQFLTDFCAKQQRYLGEYGEIPWALFWGHLAHASRARESLPYDKVDDKNIAALSGDIWILDSKQLALARSHDVIKRLPYLEEEDIADRSKSDELVKFLAVLHVLWLIIQLITRKVLGLPSTALEISTVAFSVSAFIIYLIEWPKPKDVRVPIYLETNSEVEYSAFEAIAKAAPFSYMQSKRYYIPNSVLHKINNEKFKMKDANMVTLAVGIISITLFGGIHLFAWNFDFPTSVEQLLWRISAIITVAAPYIYVLAAFSGVPMMVYGWDHRVWL